jgi:hypothetical protein
MLDMRPVVFPFVIATAACPSLLLASCDWMQKKDGVQEAREEARERARTKRWQDACASSVTYDRLKQVVFDEAMRIRNADPANLDKLATYSVVRMERPIVKSRDETLDITVCSGRFILELPPGAERGFAGQRRLTADIEYAARAAADGSGLVYQMKGAEPIIYNLAAFDLKVQPKGPATAAAQLAARRQETPAPTEAPSQGADSPMPQPSHPVRTGLSSPSEAQPPPNQPQPKAARTVYGRPSFNCRYAHTRSEQMVCESDRLSSLDRAMASLYYSALSDADERTRAALRRTRDRFLAYRERCSNEGCVAASYHERMAEIRDIAEQR